MNSNSRHQIVRRMACLVLAGTTLNSPAPGQETLDSTQFVSGSLVRSAFRDVVADARNWTVRILVDGDPSAMGVVVRDDGWILTKASRVNGDFACRFLDGRILTARRRHVWSQHDLALLKVDAEGLTSVEWADGNDPEVGQWLATAGHTSSPLGVGIVSVTRRSIPIVRLRGVLGVRLKTENGMATVVEVIEDSAAERAKLQSGDVVLRIDDHDIPDHESMIQLIREHEPGQKLQLKVKRGDDELAVEVTLTHPFGTFLRGIAEQNQMGGELSRRRSGFPAVIQHDTVLSPDECGGTVVGLDGRAVGINIARAGRTETYAIPAAVIVPLLNRWLENVDDEPGNDNAVSLPPAPPTAVRVAN